MNKDILFNARMFWGMTILQGQYLSFLLLKKSPNLDYEWLAPIALCALFQGCLIAIIHFHRKFDREIRELRVVRDLIEGNKCDVEELNRIADRAVLNQRKS